MTVPLPGDSAAASARVAGPRLHLLTMLRFLAASWVLVFHLQSHAPLATGPWLANFLANGALAMTLFFLLSGAVLTLGYRDLQLTAPDLTAFYRSRLARIMPALLTVQLLGLFWFSPDLVGGWPRWIYVNAFSFAGLQAWFVEMTPYGANGGTWSISVELFFYAVFPVALPLMVYARRQAGMARLTGYLVLGCGVLGLMDYMVGGNFFYYIAPYCRLPEFVIGIVVGLALADPPPARPHPGLTLVLAATVAAAAALNPAHRYGLWPRANFFVVPAFAWLIFSLARFEQHHAGRSWRTGVGRVFVYLGESSYCLFLVQLVPLMALGSPAGKLWLADALHAHGPGPIWLGVIGLSLAGGIFLHELIEKPARRALLRRRPA